MRKLQALAVGAVGGVLGAALMVPSHSVMAKLLGLPSPTGEDATEKVATFFARKFTGRKLRRSRKSIGGQVVHFAFAAGVGALYGLLATGYQP